MKLNKTITINCTAEELWDWLVTFEKNQQWNECLLEVKKISDGEVKEGFKSRILMQEGKKKVWYDEEILEYSPHDRLKIALKGGNLGKSPMIVDYQIIPNNANVKINFTSSWMPKGLILKLFHKAITKASDKNAEQELQSLKKQIENQK